MLSRERNKKTAKNSRLLTGDEEEPKGIGTPSEKTGHGDSSHDR
jgi:hypothetical protein